MEYTEMTKEDLIKEIEKLNKKLYHKKVSRLSWKKIMNSRVVKGSDYWSNGHFALYNTIAIPEAVNKLKDIYPTDTETSLEALINKEERTTTDKALWTENDSKEVVTEHGQRFQKLYTDMLEKLIPGYELKLTGDMSPALIYKDGDMVGLLMPLRDEA